MRQNFKIAGIGELLWDILPSGKHLGGAPPNFIFHTSQLGCESFIISALGNDPLGNELREQISRHTLSTTYIQTNSYPTGTVDVEVDAQGLPTYTIHKPVAWDFTEWNPALKTLAPQLDAVCFGTLGQRSETSAATIQTLLTHLNPKCLKVFDINLRQHDYNEDIIRHSLAHSDILKLNEEELPIVAHYFGFAGNEEQIIGQLLALYPLQYIIYTQGSRGSHIMNRTEASFMEAPPVKVSDTVGAGDSFTAAVVTGLLRGRPLTEIHRHANEVAAYVCTQPGATPILPDTLR